METSVIETIERKGAPLFDLETVVCLCGANDSDLRYERTASAGVERWEAFSPTVVTGLIGRIVQCRRCGLVYKSPRESQRFYEEQYRKVKDTFYIEEASYKHYQALRDLRLLERYQKPPGELLDIGCHAGFFLEVAKERGWKVSGIEPSVFGASFAREQLKLNIQNGFLDQATLGCIEERYDVITLFEVLGSLHQPRRGLPLIHHALKKGGLLLLTTPDIESFWSRLLGYHWWQLDRPYLYYFSKKSLFSLLEGCGFEPILFTTHPKTCSVKFLVGCLGDPRAPHVKLLQRITSALGLSRCRASLNLRDKLLVIAKKV